MCGTGRGACYNLFFWNLALDKIHLSILLLSHIVCLAPAAARYRTNGTMTHLMLGVYSWTMGRRNGVNITFVRFIFPRDPCSVRADTTTAFHLFPCLHRCKRRETRRSSSLWTFEFVNLVPLDPCVSFFWIYLLMLYSMLMPICWFCVGCIVFYLPRVKSLYISKL